MILFLVTWTLELHREHKTINKKKIKKSLIFCVCSLFKTVYNLKLTEYVALTTMVRYVSVVSVKQNALIFVSKLNGVSHQIDVYK